MFIEIELRIKSSIQICLYLFDFEGNERLCGKQQSGPKNHKQLRLLDSRGKVG